MKNIEIQNAEVVAWAKDYAEKIKRGEAQPFHALLCDPPYHLVSISKPFGNTEQVREDYANRTATINPYARLSKRGFMGKTWDGGDVAFSPETWAAFSEIMHDGAFGMAFASTRGWHRQAVAIEDAGFIIHPVIMCWFFGSGFPKATRIDTQVDKAAGAVREIVGEIKRGSVADAKARGASYLADPANRNNKACFGYGTEQITAPATDIARAWQGHRYGLQALKPALEPIIVFQKPYRGKPFRNIVDTGAGALNIGASRIGSEKVRTAAHKDLGTNGIYNHSKPFPESETRDGRWASNFVMTCPPDCVGDNHAEHCPAYLLDSKAQEIGDVSRFFFQSQYDALESSDPVFYTPKAGRYEKDAGLDGMPEIKHAEYGDFAGTPEHASNQNGKQLNPHPTVKPLALTRYLSTILLPPDMYAPRRLFVPFAGVASEIIGAYQAGWDEVIGVEMTEEYIGVAQARIDYWSNNQNNRAATSKDTTNDIYIANLF